MQKAHKGKYNPALHSLFWDFMCCSSPQSWCTYFIVDPPPLALIYHMFVWSCCKHVRVRHFVCFRALAHL
jgi:hypothetical protein